MGDVRSKFSKERMRLDSTLDDALFDVARGWSVIPVAAGDKRPLVRWQRFQTEPADAATIRRWLQRWPQANLAIVTGAVSGLVVLDVDPAHGGTDSLAALERRYGSLPETIEVRTGGGGSHFWFRHPGGFFANRIGFRPGLDLRGDGGYVVAPPSLHPSGRRYLFAVDHHPAEVEIAPLPAWLATLDDLNLHHHGHPKSYWRNLVAEGVDAGQRNTTLASLTGHLLWHGVGPVMIEELLQCWTQIRCRRPLVPTEVTRTVRRIVRTQARHSGALPFAGAPWKAPTSRQHQDPAHDPRAL
jgi:hypothetical protein